MIPLSESDFIDRKNQSEEPVDATAAAALLSVVAAEEAWFVSELESAVAAMVLPIISEDETSDESAEFLTIRSVCDLLNAVWRSLDTRYTVVSFPILQ